MAALVVSFGIFQLWMYGFVSTIFSHSFWWGYALSLIVINAFIFTADHANDSPDNLFIIFVWWTFTYPIGSSVALMAVLTLDLPKLININVLNEKEKWAVWTVVTFVFVWGWIVFYAGINFVLLRFTKTGMSPIGGISDSDSTAAGIILLAIFVSTVVVVTIGTIYSKDKIAKRNLKYLYLMAFLVWTGFIHDSQSGDIPEPWPGVLMLAALVVLIALAIPLFYYIPASDLDPYHRNISGTLVFLGVFALLLLPAQMLGWFTNDTTDGDHIAVFFVILVYSAVVVLIMLALKIFVIRERNVSKIDDKTKIKAKNARRQRKPLKDDDSQKTKHQGEFLLSRVTQ